MAGIGTDESLADRLPSATGLSQYPDMAVKDTVTFGGAAFQLSRVTLGMTEGMSTAAGWCDSQLEETYLCWL